jgi:hypothetical protein
MENQNKILSRVLLDPSLLAHTIHTLLGTATGIITTPHSSAYNDKLQDDASKSQQHSLHKPAHADSIIISHTISEIERILRTCKEDALEITEEAIVYALSYVERIGKRQLSCGTSLFLTTSRYHWM